VKANDNASLSADINELTARLLAAHRQDGRDEGSSSSSRAAVTAALAGDERVSSDLIVSSLAVLKLEKQTRLQKVSILTRLTAFATVTTHTHTQARTGTHTVDKCKKPQFIHSVNGDGSKTAKIIKRQC